MGVSGEVGEFNCWLARDFDQGVTSVPDSDRRRVLSGMKRIDLTLDDVCRADRAGRIIRFQGSALSK